MTSVAAKFDSKIGTLESNYRELRLALNGKKREESLANVLAEQFVMTTATAFECFLSDIVLDYFSCSPDHYTDDLQARMKSSIKERFGDVVTKWCKFEVPAKVSQAQWTLLLDPKGFNVSFTSADQLSKAANKYLAAEFAKKFSLPKDDRLFFDYLVALRNYLAHKSKRSRTELTKTAGKLSKKRPNSELFGNIKNVPKYLKTAPSGKDDRVVAIMERVRDIARQLG